MNTQIKFFEFFFPLIIKQYLIISLGPFSGSICMSNQRLDSSFVNIRQEGPIEKEVDSGQILEIFIERINRHEETFATDTSGTIYDSNIDNALM